MEGGAGGALALYAHLRDCACSENDVTDAQISVAEAAAHGCLGRYARRLKLILRRFAVIEDGFFFISVEDDYFVFAFVKRLFLADYLLN